MEVPRLGLSWSLLAYTTATATKDLSCVCDLHHSSWQCWSPDSLIKGRGQTHILMDTSWIHFYCATMGIPSFYLFRKHLYSIYHVPVTLQSGLPELAHSVFLKSMWFSDYCCAHFTDAITEADWVKNLHQGCSASRCITRTRTQALLIQGSFFPLLKLHLVGEGFYFIHHLSLTNSMHSYWSEADGNDIILETHVQVCDVMYVYVYVGDHYGRTLPDNPQVRHGTK